MRAEYLSSFGMMFGTHILFFSLPLQLEVLAITVRLWNEPKMTV
jgi:hypothetical protein